MLAGRPHEAAGNGSPRWMAAGPRERVHRTRPTGRLARRLTWVNVLVDHAGAGITTDEFDAACRSWLASARHPRFGRPYPMTVYQPVLELLGLLDRHGFSCWIFSGGGTDFMRTWTADGYGLPPHRVIGSVGETEFRVGDGGPELVKTTKIQVLNDGPQKPSSIHRYVGQRPIMAAGNTDGDLAMLQWTAASPCRTLQLVVRHTDGDREYAYDRDPILGSGTDQILAATAEHKWTVIDMADDWATIHPPGEEDVAPASLGLSRG